MRSGGAQQRKRKREDDERRCGLHSSSLATHLIYQFAWGAYSPQEVQRLASLALNDMKKVARPEDLPQDLIDVAAIGAGGKHPSKCHGDLIKLVEPQIKLPQPTVAKLPFKAPVKEHDQAMFLPHEVFASLYKDYGDAWVRSMVPSEGNIPEFWDSVAEHPSLQNHPLKLRGDFRSKCIPIGLHGDDVPCTGLGKCWVSKQTQFSWYSLLATGESTKDGMFWIYGCMEKLRSNDLASHTMHKFLHILAWSFLWLSRGQWPDEDWNGKKLLVMV